MPLLKPRDIILDNVIGEVLQEQGLDQGIRSGKKEIGEDAKFRSDLNFVGASVENASLVLAQLMLDGECSESVRLNAAREVLLLHGKKTKEGFAPPIVPIFQFNIGGPSGQVNLNSIFAPHRARGQGAELEGQLG